MGFFSKPIRTLDDLFVHTLQDIYYAENQIAKHLPTMIEKSGSTELRAALEMHLTETRSQVTRLERVFEMHGEPVKAVTCAAMDGILEESRELASEINDPHVLDVALLGSAQAVEHYEITRYGTLIALAQQLGRSDCAIVLQEILEEEKSTDVKLTRIAAQAVNRDAAA